MSLRLRLPWALATVVTVGHLLAGYTDTKSKLNGSRLTLLLLLLAGLETPQRIRWLGKIHFLSGPHSVRADTSGSSCAYHVLRVGQLLLAVSGGWQRRRLSWEFKDGGCLEDRSYLRPDVVRRLFLARDRPQISTSLQARWVTVPLWHLTQLWHLLFWAEGEFKRHLLFTFSIYYLFSRISTLATSSFFKLSFHSLTSNLSSNRKCVHKINHTFFYSLAI